MTPQEITSVLSSYSLRSTACQRPDGSRVFLAWYEELPGCVAEASNRDDALAELDAVIPAVLAQLAADGIPAPVASGAPEVTNTIQLSGLVVGGSKLDLAVATVEPSSTKLFEGVMQRT